MSNHKMSRRTWISGLLLLILHFRRIVMRLVVCLVLERSWLSAMLCVVDKRTSSGEPGWRSVRRNRKLRVPGAGCHWRSL